jgi:ankyrin repeat protein
MNTLSLTSVLSSGLLDPYQGQFRSEYGIILRQAGFTLLELASVSESIKSFRAAIEFESSRLANEGKEWPHGIISLGLLCGFAKASRKDGALAEALDSMRAALQLAEITCGYDSVETAWIVSFLKEIEERQEVLQRHHKYALVASTSTVEGSRDSKKYLSNEEPSSRLIQAASAGRVEEVRGLILLLNVDLDTQSQGTSALAEASVNGHVDVVGLLLDTGRISLESKNTIRNVKDVAFDSEAPPLYFDGCTPLWGACLAGCTPVVKQLLENGANVNCPDSKGTTASHLAILHRDTAILHLLLEQGVEHRSKNQYGMSPLHFACQHGRQAMVQMLLDQNPDQPASIRETTSNGDTLLHIAIRHKQEGIVKLLLERGAAPDATNAVGNSSLHHACALGQASIVEMLLNRGLSQPADIEFKNADG